MMYDYKCINCGKVFEAETDINVAHLPVMHRCTECNCIGQHDRHFSSAPPVIFKGKGWTPKGK
jgi:predicted nucleic acid-binding Zn ribbon protein